MSDAQVLRDFARFWTASANGQDCPPEAVMAMRIAAGMATAIADKLGPLTMSEQADHMERLVKGDGNA